MLDFDHPVHLANSAESAGSGRASGALVKLRFRKSKFQSDRLNASSPFEHYERLAKLTVLTNLTSFDIPLRIYDGLLQLVSVALPCLGSAVDA